MQINNSILAGEILLTLEKCTCSIRIIDLETMFQAKKVDAYLAIARLLSEGLINLIENGERGAIVLTTSAEIREINNFKNRLEPLMVSGQV